MSHHLSQHTPHLWTISSQAFFYHSGILISEGQACLIDPGLRPDEIKAIVDFVAERGAVPHAIILTHAHWDHLLGPEHLPGVKIIAHAKYPAELEGKRNARIQRQIAAWETENGIERERPFILPYPDETFEDDMSVIVGNLSLRLIHAPGHASDQLVVYHADTATLWAADMLSDLEIPYVSHDLAAYRQTLETLSTLDTHVLIPAHGHPTTDAVEIDARFSGDIAYLAEIESHIKHAISQGKSIKETVELCAGICSRYPEENQRPHKLNIESIYVELGGQADPTKIGWTALD